MAFSAQFILVDLRSQMPYLPRYMKAWSRPRLLAWMRTYGTVDALEAPDDEYTQRLMKWDREHGRPGVPRPNRYFFRSWSGLSTVFVLTEDLELYIPDSLIRAWDRQVTE